MEILSQLNIKENILPEFFKNIEDLAEKNDFESAELILNESKQYFEKITVLDSDIRILFYPAYRLAYLLNHKEFCYKLMLKVAEVTGYYDFETTFFNQS
ncbi:unnamed protein product, partial [Brachionus calyciflorus]